VRSAAQAVAAAVGCAVEILNYRQDGCVLEQLSISPVLDAAGQVTRRRWQTDVWATSRDQYDRRRRWKRSTPPAAAHDFNKYLRLQRTAAGAPGMDASTATRS
jgi:hypothetical protein